ncbi:FAD/FMN-containing dehydrogenase [Breoghania corrubedonensis]|uniref:FAD/FMN-containing dehydrogenase n=1 Tax=Breoghania corrubedonensis TaxID=665038 RepID=A0A2T5VH06_9HYPH|nr:FAD-binding oxidoreductase [Breoghania corrubedonensis]PTW63030.1 FAD/FMN-containing dehydrogenase [Breoghania corrubedonensis]
MDRLKDFRAEIDGIPFSDDAATLRIKSRDFFWFSPVLRAELEGRVADIVVRPRDKRDLLRVAAAAARARLPLTVRGGGTGNYGQAVPLAGGVVLDMTHLDRLVRVMPGAARMEAGATMLEIDRALKPTGWELRLHPSTRQSATIGGFLAGGAAGVGSCTWGQISDRGAVLSVEVVTLEEEPRILELSGDDVMRVIHAYGVNGIITEVELALAPVQPWAERIYAFPSLAKAAAFGKALTAADAIARKLVSIHDARIPPLIKRLSPIVPAGSAMAIVMVSEPQAAIATRLAEMEDGECVFERSAQETDAAAFSAIGAMPPLYEYTWNHTTLHAMRHDPTLTYLQIRYPPDNDLAVIDKAARAFPDDLITHLEFQRRFGRVGVSALSLVRYSGRDPLYKMIEKLDAIGASVSNPHTCRLDNAGWKRIDAPQPDFKAAADPFGLMNPGKLVDWPAPDTAVEPPAEPAA